MELSTIAVMLLVVVRGSGPVGVYTFFGCSVINLYG